jgi:hypothetical protein
MRGYLVLGCSGLLFAACGGGTKPAKKPVVEKEEAPVEKKETEEDRAEQRLAAAHKIVPDGSACLPLSLKEDGAPRLELAASGTDALICAMDVGCWKIDLASGGLAYKSPEPLPGRGFQVKLDDGCARGYCLPKDAKSDASTAHVAWDAEAKKVAVLVGEDVHLFDAGSKEHESTFTIRGDKGVVGSASGIYFVGTAVVVEGKDEGSTGVWVFKTDGTQLGPVVALGSKDEKPLSIHKGSVSVLDKARIGFAERGMETMTVYEVADGKRSKLVRNAKKPACKPAEFEAYWKDGDKVGDKCKGSIDALSGHLIGATAVAGAKNFLVLLRGERLGELGVLDSKTLQEKKAIKMPWCAADAAGEDKAEGKEKEEATDTKVKTRGSKDSSDPEEGGE